MDISLGRDLSHNLVGDELSGFEFGLAAADAAKGF